MQQRTTGFRRFGIAGVVAVVALAGCGDDASTTPTGSTSPDVTDTTGPTTSSPTTSSPTRSAPVPATSSPATSSPATSRPATVDVRVYFLRGERLAITHASVEGPAVLRAAVTALVADPPVDLLTAIPSGTRLLDVALRDGTATVDLSNEFGSGGGTLSMTARVAQVVFTATQFDNVERVVFWIDGSPVEYLGGEGLQMDEPWTRADVARDVTGGVLIDTPLPGETVRSPFLVSGEADVYEGDFPIEIRRGGQVLAVIAPISGGAWGDWADFSATIDIDVEPGPIELVAYDEGGCGTGPECPPVIETIVPLVLQ